MKKNITRLVFATNNPHKLEEVKSIIGDQFEIVSLKEINCHEDIPETGSTLQANALQKARYVKEMYGFDCFADDTGLEVKALDNAPGVYSARYAGEERSAEKNMEKLLWNMNGKEDRQAVFKTVIALILEDQEYLFEGEVHGVIKKEKSGNAGFGYDPIFQPEGYEQTFAEMGDTEKNKISHRARATEKFANFLKDRSKE